jgi:hypothetical protein
VVSEVHSGSQVESVDEPWLSSALTADPNVGVDIARPSVLERVQRAVGVMSSADGVLSVNLRFFPGGRVGVMLNDSAFDLAAFPVRLSEELGRPLAS